MSARAELAAAGITDPALQADYAHCRALAAGHGQTYFLATRLLPAARRPAVHALYGFARTADEIVDNPGDDSDPQLMLRRLNGLSAELAAGTDAHEPSCRAVADTARRYDIEPGLFEDFLSSMRMDLTVTQYETYADLERYMHGSAAVIGLQMLPVLGTIGAVADAAPFATRLGIAFQLTNFIRDLGEDLRRGRVYLPQESLRRFGVDRDRLERGAVDGPIRDLLRFEIKRTREIYRAAEPGIARLEPRSRACVATAFTLYRAILDEVERADYRVLDRRVSVPVRRRLPVALAGLSRTLSGRARPTATTSG